ncbi:MAG: hybrid sensor histidine kinase/response regulator [Desulfovibrionaceae bacterium]|jgi:DNA-binding response OmpR family regulator|nr:hybrid sensor histidine kinase/response regulator [Desulfovibrionaceae bacterium]
MATNCTILAIDDSKSALEIIRGVLATQEGVTLLLAHSGVEGLAVARERLPDIILLDVVMPPPDGYQTCRAIRADPTLAEVPVLMVTSLEDRASRLEGLAAGADDFISKPFDADELVARIQSIARLNRYRRLHAERAKFEWVIQNADDAYVAVDGLDTILYANRQARLCLGLPEAVGTAGINGTGGDGTTAGKTETGAGRGIKFLKQAVAHFSLQPEEAWAAWPAHPAETPLYLVRPESESSPGQWLQATVFDQPGGAGATRLLQLRDVTQAMTNHRDMWTFQSMISHKLRTPLSGILFSLDLLAADNAGLSRDECAQMTRMAKENAQRLYEQIEDVLGYLERPSAPAPDQGFVLDSFTALVLQAGRGLSIRRADVSVERVPEELARRTLTLPARSLEWVLLELLENAQKFHPHNAPRLEIGLCAYGADAVLLTVADDGRGLTPAQLTQVWAPYFQVEKAHTFEVEGMGLGLARIATTVWGVGGSCRIANRTDGPGMVVELVLPLAPTA